MTADIKAHNESIASDYSTIIYDPVLSGFVDVDRIFGQAAMFGTLGRPVDVLDLACGTGAQLARIAPQVKGRLVGVDISPEPVRIAQERLAQFGKRADVRCADLLETDAEALGQFDLIYNIGVIYATPPVVQQRILELIGKCLRPGGVALMSYHSGGAPALRRTIHKLLTAGLQGLAAGEAVVAARRRSADLRARLQGAVALGQGGGLLLAALDAIDAQSDIVFYHEVFNPYFGPMYTTTVAQDLGAYGVDFAWYMAPSPDEFAATSLDRAIAADVADLAAGQYRYAVFARYLEPGLTPVTSPLVRWGSVIERANPGVYEGEQTFTRKGDAAGAIIRVPASMAMFDAMGKTPMSWDQIVKAVAKALGRKPGDMSADDLAAMRNDLRFVWRLGLALPFYRAPKG